MQSRDECPQNPIAAELRRVRTLVRLLAMALIPLTACILYLGFERYFHYAYGITSVRKLQVLAPDGTLRAVVSTSGNDHLPYVALLGSDERPRILIRIVDNERGQLLFHTSDGSVLQAWPK